VIGAALLLTFFATMLMACQYALPSATWLHRAPRLGIAVWQVAIAAVTVSFVLGMMALTMPGLSAAAALAEFARACVIELQRQYAHPGWATLTTVSLAILGLLAWRMTSTLWSQRRADLRAQRDHLADLALVAEPGRQGVLNVDHEAAAVYCLPGNPRAGTHDTVVVTTGARAALSDAQLDLVLRHEHAHLNSRHARLVARARALNRAFPRVGFFRVAHDQIALLAELQADDAVRAHERRSLAGALYQLAIRNQRVPTANGLSATGSDVILRARRLMRPHEPLGRTAQTILATSILLLGTTPVVLSLIPGGLSESHDCCSTAGVVAASEASGSGATSSPSPSGR